MNRARYAHKFMLIFMVFMLPYCGLAVSKLSDMYRLLEQSRQEMHGLDAIEQYLPVYRKSLELSGLHVISYGRNKPDVQQAIAKHGEDFIADARALNQQLSGLGFADQQSPENDPGLKAEKNKLRVQGLSSQMIEHGRSLSTLIGNMNEIAATAKLSQDSDAEIYRNVALLTNKLIPLYDVLSQTRTFTGYLTAYGYLEATSTSSILNQVGSLQQYVDLNDGKGNAQARSLMAEAAQQALSYYQKEVVSTFTQSGYFDLDAVDQWHAQYDRLLPQVETLQRAEQVLLQDTRSRLQARIDANSSALLIWLSVLLLVVLLLVYLFVGFFLSVRMAIHNITGATRKMAEGDLQHPIKTQARDELGDLADDFNEMQRRMSGLISKVAGFSESTQGKAQNVSRIAATSQSSIQQQARELELIATSMSELVSNVQEVSQNSHITADKANAAGDKCREGRTQVDGAVARINQLFNEMDNSIAAINSVEKESHEIAKAVDLIKSVAEQTNLLALNAAIEAARAGEQGRGFAVVADEVRSLAIRSHQLTGEIDQTIERLRQQVNNAVRTIHDSHQSAAQSVEQITLTANIFEQITGSMEQIIDHNIQIASAAEEQAAVVQGVEQNTLQIKALSDSNATEACNAVQISDELAGMTRDLHGLIAAFKV
ncbi:methyl-accepting chemotaxis protein [Pseudomonas sp. 5P_3.1_Bac2]|nr:methyl-accepting chemotaxis protein [Pseudomonas sp. 5P_3.1_Bac2]MCU1719401.1 methyl-accepting chemotaxis protein [Pseudomonas sp. 5P_3.1_Bac2]